MTRRSARDVLALVLDSGSFASWDEPIDLSGYSDSYRAELRRAADRSGSDEAVVTGRGLVQGRPVALVVSDFGFLGGSVGRAAADRIVAAVRRATRERLPLLAVTSSGGTRMQEGAPAFYEMVAITRAVMAHREAGLPYLVHLRNPTTGGVYASWGSLGQVVTAEPGALVGFLGPKVYEAIEGRPFPHGVQQSEQLAEKGIVDAVVATEHLADLVDRILAVLCDPADEAGFLGRGAPVVAGPVWESVELTRDAGRAGVRELLRYGGTSTVLLRGIGPVVLALTRVAGHPCVLVGQDRSSTAPLGPAALRLARRGMRLAAELGLPLVTVVDTPGAELSAEAEEGGLAGEIARCIATLSGSRVPTVSVLLGQGCGGGALALLPADVVVATEHAWLSPLPPEGASVILFGDVTHAAEMAEAQGIGASSLRAAGIVDQIVAELPGDDAESLARAVAGRVATELARLSSYGEGAGEHSLLAGPFSPSRTAGSPGAPEPSPRSVSRYRRPALTKSTPEPA